VLGVPTEPFLAAVLVDEAHEVDLGEPGEVEVCLTLPRRSCWK
jgi:hypothetical protein